MEKQMKKQIKGYITFRDTYGRQEFDFLTYDPTQFAHNDRIVVRQETIEVEIPDDFDPRPEQVRMLQEQQQKVRAEMSARINELQERINKLLALEMTVEAE
jgi:hypothetical protein